MDEIASTTTRRPAPGTVTSTNTRMRTNRTAMPQIPGFGDEPICSELIHSLDDVLLSGSDDEYYESPSTRSLRLEEQARLFLEGRRPFLVSASLRGPLGKEHGWENPWRGRGGKVSKTSVSQAKPQQTKARRMAATARPNNVSSTTPPLCKELGATPSVTNADTEPEPKKRAASADWLRRKNLKRMKPGHDELLTPSPTASRTIRAAAIGKTPEAPVLARSFSAPTEDVCKYENANGGSPSRESTVALDYAASHISDSEIFTSISSDLLRGPHSVHGHESTTSTHEVEASLPAQPDSAVAGADISVHVAEDDDSTDLASQQILAEDTQFETQKDDSFHFKRLIPVQKGADIPTPQNTLAEEDRLLPQRADETRETENFDPGEAIPSHTNTPSTLYDGTTLLSIEHDNNEDADEHIASLVSLDPNCNSLTWTTSQPKIIDDNVEDVHGSDISTSKASDGAAVSHFADMTETTCAMDCTIEDAAAEELPTVPAATDLEDARLATQLQSPWSKTQPITINEDTVMENSITSGADDDEDVGSEDGGASAVVQSPWSKEVRLCSSEANGLPLGLPVDSAEPTGAVPEISTTTNPSISLSQNPWADENKAATCVSSSLPNLPTSPCSPAQNSASERPPSEEQPEPFLPTLPIAIPMAPSSGTAPSTPDTKQSSLPTPDMTVSIKSFRIFRSPTPTPQPRRRNAKAGALRSALAQPRRKSGALANASRSNRRVHFDLPGDEGGDNDSGDLGAPAVPNTEARDDEEEDFIEAGLLGTSRGRQYTYQFQTKSLQAPRPPQRAASPPPQDKALMASLPSEVDKFQGHFAMVAGRAQNVSSPDSQLSPLPLTLLKTNKATSHEIYSSPSVDAMASRFLEVDAETSKLQQITSQQSLMAAPCPQESNGGKMPGSDKENVWGGDSKHNGSNGTGNGDSNGDGNGNGNDDDGDEAMSAVDDVQDVIDNLDDFLGLWDMDAELAQARAGRL